MIDSLKMEHFYMLNNRMREVEEEIIAKDQCISKHLMQSINEGMEEYRIFIIDGIMLIEPCGDDVPHVTEKFLKLPRHTVYLEQRAIMENPFRTTLIILEIKIMTILIIRLSTPQITFL